ncbi:MAG: Isoprenyl transferase [Candidatus Beckwithbacteria bacterium GW2011_GWB1_47_15]|uniref:Isoprenyl transferase n=1 Tax=Candidatus Beckwithbacteria bacterium GW2011_GWB1_47_15 TaxID=1618371 RepID=A0A0G1RTP2_9BACT|nr:MAG: Isoprenyl transferase [Candidatus Beckwithbacteria bacterium GW2011_GWB1_47_15]
MTLPRHIAIIADGNRRWAKLKNLPEFSGHEHAVRVTMESLVDRCIDLKIPYLTFWVFSTENWRRGKTWVDRYFKLLRSFFNENVDKYQKKGAKLNLIGDLTKLPPDIKKSLIRPGGHSRFSGFMLYQAAYAQLYFTATLFPDFDAGQLDKVLDWYAKQQQNLGK